MGTDPMRVLILGVTGMLGHKIYQRLALEHDVIGTIRGHYRDVERYGLFQKGTVVPEVDALKLFLIEEVIQGINPDVLINCIGIVKQVSEAQDRFLSIQVNSLFPHQLGRICDRMGIRLIHISTDCVFSGRKGNYREDDPSDAEDDYGKTKYLGEVKGSGALTIRTSIIGRELATANGLVEWLISKEGGKVNGFTNAIFSGFPTLHFAGIVADIIANHRGLSGIYHISSEPISKLQLLNLVRENMGLDLKIEEHSEFVCNRSLDSIRYRSRTGFKPLSWERMIEEFSEDACQYQQWRCRINGTKLDLSPTPASVRLKAAAKVLRNTNSGECDDF